MDKMSTFVFAGFALCLAASAVAGICEPVDKLDVVFIIDNSASIPGNDFEAVKEFAIGLIDNMAEVVASVNIGLIEFSNKAVPSIWLRDQANRKSQAKILRQKFRNLTQPEENFNTNTHLALFIARSQMLNKTYDAGAGCACPKVIVLITDGAPSWPTFAFNEAAATREAGIHLFVVGTGSEENFPSGTMGSRMFLALYFTGGDESMVFRASDYRHLENIAASVIEATCQVVRSEIKPKAAQISIMDEATYDGNAPNV